MAFSITKNALNASLQTDITPQIVLEIEGFDKLYGAIDIKKFIKYGDPDLEFGDGSVFGGLNSVDNQSPYISFSGSGGSTSTTIRQQLNVDKGTGDSISSIGVVLIDKNGEVSKELITPDEDVTPAFDILGRRAKVWLGFSDVAWPEDFFVVFRGTIDSVETGSGFVKINLNSPDSKKKGKIFTAGTSELTSISKTFAPADVNTTTDKITLNGHGFTSGTPVSFSSTDTIPAGLGSGFIVNPATNTFQVANQLGGEPQNITTQGVGTHSIIAGMSSGDTVANVLDATEFLDPTFLGPSGIIDTGLTYFFRIDNEIIQYEAKTPTQLQTLTRGAFGTTASSHGSGDSVESIYVVSGNSIDISLKLMLSGSASAYKEDLPITSFVRYDGTETEANTIFFQDFNPVQQFNLIVGDFVTTTGATNGANNVTDIEIIGITERDQGYTITLDSAATLVEEATTSAIISFRSQYSVWPAGAEMIPDEVDIKEHLSLQRLFLNNDDDYQFLLREEIELKEFLGEQIYNPLGAFSLPRKARASVGFHLAGLLPGGKVKQLDSTNTKNASKLRVKRSTSKNFFNATVYKFDEDFLEEDRFLNILSTINTDSRERIPVGVRALVIEAKGLRTIQGAVNIAASATARRLNKYKFGAEYLMGVKLNFKGGFDLEVGDVVLFDFNSLKVTDIKEGGTREGDVRLMQIDNKSLNIKTGEISIDLVDTNFEADNRFGLISPASYIRSGVDNRNFTIEASFNTTEFGQNEFRKWEDFIGSEITVRSTDGAITGNSIIQSISGNSFQVETSLGFTPSAGQLLTFSAYQATQPLANVKLLYVFQFDGVSFADGDPSYKML